ncbi:MAG: dihydropteroate synthase [Deltaproteobacteria bacterium]|nr:dihydropteroate synthase [Deltaproteobacteria bacterium]
MGILNLTPDSFSDGGQYSDVESVIKHAKNLVESGATILDLGGESSRPGSEPVAPEEESRRVLPVIEALLQAKLGATISVDTTKAVVADQAASLGAEIINDISALNDPNMAAVAAKYRVGLIVMHMRGTPKTMQTGEITYDNVGTEVLEHLKAAIERAKAAGVTPERIMVDPGIGFGKNLEHNLALTQSIGELKESGCRILYGPSRKRFLGEITGRDVGDRDRATAAACAIAAYEGADIFRVHDVAAVRDAVEVGFALRTKGS